VRTPFPALATIVLYAVTLASTADVPKNWFMAGSHPQDYVASLDRTAAHNGGASAMLASRSDHPKGFGTLMQTIQPASFRGKRLQFTAHVRSQGIKEWAGLWLRVDGTGTSPLSFDNMQDRPIRGNSDWKSVRIVLDVPQEATAIAFGILLYGPGKVWLDSARFDVVDASVATTGAPAPGLPKTPSNMDFEQ
jgi:hypothetical protein